MDTVAKDQSIKDFSEGLSSLHLLSACIDFNDKQIILIIRTHAYASPDSEPQCIFKLIEKEKLWIKHYDFNAFSLHKKQMGFDGSWQAFFKTLDCAINKTEGGEIQIKYTKTNKEKLIMTIFHPLADDLKVKSEIIFDKSYTTNSEEYRSLNFDAMFELYQSKEIYREKEKLALASGMNSQSKGNEGNMKRGVGDGRKGEGRAQLEIKKNIKRKYVSNLINPNIKKRKSKGVEFIQDEEEEEESALEMLQMDIKKKK